jgi:peptide/nickel transport system substrate-binding protein
MAVNSAGTSYTLNLRPNLKWQDGKPLTTADVLFTFRLIQNPDVNSPLRSYFEGVSVTAKGNSVTFTIPNPLSSFPDYLNVGILPQHILSTVPVSELRSSSFNTQNPIGSGPFVYKSLAVKGNDPTNAEVQINLAPNKSYVLGEPKLNAFIVHAYASQNQLVSAMLSGKLNGAEGISVPPTKILKNKKFVENNLTLTAGSYVFFRTTNNVLSDQKVRSALEQSINIKKIIEDLGYNATAVDSPFLKNQVEYNQQYAQNPFNLESANAILDQDGWVRGSNGVRAKNGQSLKFNFTIPNIAEYVSVADKIKADWQNVGAQADIMTLDIQDFPSALNYHQYDAVLYGISIGANPDVYPYWASEMFNPATGKWTNLSEYKNTSADASLSAGRTRLDPILRRVKYAPFLSAWQADVPAVGLYQPRDLYITNGKLSIIFMLKLYLSLNII